jgi:membrane protease YdiL (CAAX protease family)
LGEPLATPDDSPPQPPAAETRITPLQQRFVAALEVVLCSGYPTQLLISSALNAFGWQPTTEASGGTALSLPFVLTLSLVDTLVVVALMIVLMRSRGESAKALWIGRIRPWREIVTGLVLVPVVFFMVVILLNAIRLFAPWLHNVPNNPLEELAGSTPVDAALFGVVAIVAGGVREELQRAFLLHRFEQYLGGATVGVIVLSTAFGLGHVLQGWDAVITTGALGAFWALIYLDRRSSIVPIVSHAGFNSLEVLRVALFGS